MHTHKHDEFRLLSLWIFQHSLSSLFPVFCVCMCVAFIGKLNGMCLEHTGLCDKVIESQIMKIFYDRIYCIIIKSN